MRWNSGNIFLAVVGAAFAAVCVLVGHSFYQYEFNWRALYRDLPTLGDSCTGAVGVWPDGKSARDLAATVATSQKLELPFRGKAVVPKVLANEFLVVRCDVDLSVLNRDGFARMNLWRPVTATTVFLNGQWVAHAARGETLDFWLAPEERRANSVVTLVSAGSERGSAGLNHPIPLVYSDQEKLLNRASYRLTAIKREIPTAMLLFAVGIGLIFSFAWVMGLRFSDLAWALVAITLFAVGRVAEHEALAEFIGLQTQFRLIGLTSIWVYLALFAFSIQFLRVASAQRAVTWTTATLALATAAFYLGVPEPKVYAWRLAYLVPSAFGLISLSVIGLVGMVDLVRRPLLARRQGRVMVFLLSTSVMAVFLGLEVVFQESRAIYVGRYLQLGLVGLYALFLAADLLWFEKQSLLAAKNRIERRHADTILSARQSMASLAHDVRRPFTYVQNVVELLRRSDSRIDPFYPELRAAIAAVDQLISDTLSFADDARQKGELVSWHDVVQTTLREFQPLLARRRIGLLMLPAIDSDQVIAHRGALQRVLTNLVANAVEATPDLGRIHIAIESGEGVTRLVVENTGSYVAVAERETVFEPFYTKGKRNGRGLGLAICKRLVTQYGGRIWCESSEDLRTRFIVELSSAAEIPVSKQG